MRPANTDPGFLLFVISCASPAADSPGLSVPDSTAVRAVEAAYVSAWLADDTAGVLATLTPDAVLLPPRALPLPSRSLIRAYWWPQDGSRTRITAFDWTIDEVGGQPPVAYTRGLSTVSWTYDKDTVHQTATVRSPNLTLLRRDPDGIWKITHQMWGPPLP